MYYKTVNNMGKIETVGKQQHYLSTSRAVAL